MAKIEVQKLMQSPLEKVVEYFGNPEVYYAIHASDASSFKIVSKENNRVVVESEQDIGGRRFKFTTGIVYHLPHSIESETVTPFGVTSKQTTTFEALPKGTRVTYKTDLKTDGMWGRVLGRLGKKSMRKMVDDEAEKDRQYLEGAQEA